MTTITAGKHQHLIFSSHSCQMKDRKQMIVDLVKHTIKYGIKKENYLLVALQSSGTDKPAFHVLGVKESG
jgi:hypothetical protein